MIQFFKATLSILIIIVLALELNADPLYFNYNGRILRPDDTPLDANSVDFTVQIVSTTNSCVLYEETHNLDMTNAAGVFNLKIGSGARSTDGNYEDISNIDQVFDNTLGNITSLTCDSGTDYDANPGDARAIRLFINEGTGVIQFSEVINMASVPYARYATKLEGMGAQDFLAVDGANNIDQSNLQNVFGGGNYGELMNLINGTSTQYADPSGSNFTPTATVDFNNQVLENLATPVNPNDAANKTYSDSYIGGAAADSASLSTLAGGADIGKVLSWNGTQWQATTPSTTDATKLPLTGGTMTGDIDMGGNDILNSGFITMTANTYLHLGTYATDPAGLTAGHEGVTWYNTTSDELKIWDGTAAQVIGGFGIGTAAGDAMGADAVPNCNANEKLQMSAGPVYAWSCVTDQTGGDIANGGNNGAITIGSNNNTLSLEANNSVAMTIATNGFVGIGRTTAPSLGGSSSRFGVKEDRNGGSLISIENADGGNSAGSGIHFGTDSLNHYMTAYGSGNTGTGTYGPNTLAIQSSGRLTHKAQNEIQFYTSGTTTAHHRMTIDSSGSVGIGLDNDLVMNISTGAKLDVEGRIVSGPTGTASGQTGEIRFEELAITGTEYVGFRAPDAVGTSQIWTLPSTDGANGTVLSTNGSGVLSWQPAGTGDFESDGSVAMSGDLNLSGNGIVNLEVGSASAPSISFNGDSDTGIYHVTSNQIGFSTSGSKKFEINQNGLEGVGSQSAYIRSAAGDASGPSYSFLSDTDTGFYTSAANTIHFTTSGANALTIDPSGNVGIGTTTPTNILEVNPAQAGAAVAGRGVSINGQDGGSGADGGSIVIDSGDGYSSGGNGGQLNLSAGNAASGSVGDGGTVTIQSGSALGTGNAGDIDLIASSGTGGGPSGNGGDVNITAGNSNSTGSGGPGDISLSAGNANAGSSDQDGGDITISGGANSGGRDGNVILNPTSGRVGIGKLNPNALLDVAGILRVQDICDEDGLNCKDVSSGWSSGTGDFESDGSVAMTGQLDLIDGTQTIPGLGFADDANTGIFSPSNDNISFTTAGNERLRISSTGHVGIGFDPTSILHIESPSPMVQIRGSGNDENISISLRGYNSGNYNHGFDLVHNDDTDNSFQINRLSAGQSVTAIHIDRDTGRVGVNTSTPTGQFEVVDDNNRDFHYYGHNNTANQGPDIYFRRSRGDSSAPTAVMDTDKIGGVQFESYDGGTYRNAAAIEATATANTGANDTPTKLQFYTRNSSPASYKSQMELDPDGNLNMQDGNRIRLYDVGSNEYISLVPPTDVTADTNLVLPNGPGTNGQVLTTDGTGVMSWQDGTAGAGDFESDGSVAMTGQLDLPDGNAVAPSLSFTNDQDTGFYNMASDGWVAYSSNGTDGVWFGSNYMTVRYGLNIDYSATGIYNPASTTLSLPPGTSSSILNKNEADQSGAFQYYTVERTDGLDQAAYVGAISEDGEISPTIVIGQKTGPSDYRERMRIDSSGNVGIGLDGSNSPDVASGAKLDVEGRIVLGPAGTASGETGEIRFEELAATGTDYVGFRAPDAVGTSQIWTLPAADGASGSVLSTNGSGVLSWQPAGTGDFESDGSVAMTGRITLADGVPATPSIGFTSDTDLGIYYGGTNTIGFTEGGTPFASLGPANGLVINGGPMIRNDGYRFQTDTNTGITNPAADTIGLVTAGNQVLTIDPSFQVGINNNSPSANLDVTGDFRVVSSGGSTSSTLESNSNTPADEPRYLFNRSRGSTLTPLQVADGDSLGGIEFGAYAPSSSYQKSVEIKTSVNGTPSGVNVPGDISFGINNGSGMEYPVYMTADNLMVTGGKDLVLADADNSAWSGFRAPATVTGSVLYTLPPADGSNGEVLTTNGSGVLSWTSGSGSGDFESDGSVAMTGDLNLGNNGIRNLELGSNAAPSISFNGDATTGFYSTGTNTINFATGGINGGSIGLNDMTIFKPIRADNGDESTPDFSFNGDIDTGIFDPAANTIGFSTAGTEKMRITSSGEVGIGTTPSGGNLIHAKNDSSNGQAIVIENKGTGANAYALFWAEGEGANNYVEMGTGGTGSGSPQQAWIATGSGTTSLSLASNLLQFGNLSGTNHMSLESSGNLHMLTENEVRFEDNSGGEYVGFRAPATVTGSQTYVLPPADGSSGNVLSTNGSGVLSWQSAGTGDFLADGSIPMTGAIRQVNGSAASPSYSFTSATNTGFFYSANAVRTSIGGTQIMSVNNPGTSGFEANILVPMSNGGLAAHDNVYLVADANNSGAGNIIFGANSRDSANGSYVEMMRIQDDGKVGIGTTSPNERLAVESTTGADLLSVRSTDAAGWSAIDFIDNSGADAGWVGYGNPSAATQTDQVYLEANGARDIGFWTDSNQRMTIASNGRVGIGTTDLSRQFTISGSFNGSGAGMTIENTSSGNLARGVVVLESDASGVLEAGHTSSTFSSATYPALDPDESFVHGSGTNGLTLISESSNANGGIRFLTNGKDDTDQKMIIDNSGNVGIGTTAPDTNLQVNNDSGIAIIKASGRSNVAAFSPAVVLTKARNSTGTNAAIQNNDIIGAFGGAGYGTSTFPAAGTARMSIEAEENFTDSAMGTRINFATTPNGSTIRQNRMTIDNAGNVGIGTTTPSSDAKLSIRNGHIETSQASAPTATVQAAAGTGASCTVTRATDTALELTLTTGTTGWSTGSYCRITFNQAYGAQPIIVFSAANASAGQAIGTRQVYTTGTTTHFDINLGNAAVSQVTSVFNIMIMGYLPESS